ncbi:hypothetical protein T440DRAFT_63054 [Plenodomus tracheiphilus IPT5]|uniref:Cell wall mannoprotein PIR1-like C-terminal domain-containing protein n=1 Tax=Plenodomus tracheiphilus IPT5 TaxID=1408161 RepID=A0A6A7B7V5_9PLEO|nr:hypothetical protein T440DRAFT_63054 [Plenodomus tracheiphilus IPT5]
MRVAGFLAPLLFAATSVAQAVEEGIAPSSGPPSGCETTVEGKFMIGTLENPTLRKRETAQQAADGDLLCTLNDGILHDQYKRTGSVVANRQFQFDGPPQAGAIYTGGFSVCKNGSLAIGGSTRWWRCMSGAFGNLYDEYIGAQCHEIRIQTISSETSSSSSIVASTSTIAASAASSAVSRSASATGSATSTASQSESVSMISGSAFGSITSTAFSTATPFSFSASSTRSGSSPSGSATGTAVAAAPPAEGLASSLYMTGATLGAALAVIGAALVL